MTPMLSLALAAVLSAGAAGRDLRDAAVDGRVPDVWAMRSPDGAWTLVLRPAGGWSAAEITVPGGTAVDLGPARGGERLTLRGEGAPDGPLTVRVLAAVDDSTGIEWRFAVDPVSVPIGSPKLERAPRRRGLFSRWFGW